MFVNINLTREKTILLLILLSAIFLFTINFYGGHNKLKSYINPNVKIFNLGSPLNPTKRYDEILCRMSAFSVLNALLCVHDITKDIYVSKNIMTYGCWECDILGLCFLFQRYLDMLSAYEKFHIPRSVYACFEPAPGLYCVGHRR